MFFPPNDDALPPIDPSEREELEEQVREDQDEGEGVNWYDGDDESMDEYLTDLDPEY